VHIRITKSLRHIDSLLVHFGEVRHCK
jgi:hypothetical protein